MNIHKKIGIIGLLALPASLIQAAHTNNTIWIFLGMTAFVAGFYLVDGYHLIREGVSA